MPFLHQNQRLERCSGAMATSRLNLLHPPFVRFIGGKHSTQANGEPLHRPDRIIGGNVFFGRVGDAGSFSQHVTGNSEPVSEV